MPFGIYIHIPYCVTKCPYCDFNSYGVGSNFPEKDYTNSIIRELEFYQDDLSGTKVTSIFFGGGTPSLFDPKNIEEILSKIYSITKPSENIEISLEVNPKTADLEKLKGLRAAGINRISTGVQSFSERKLKFLGRINTPEDSQKILQDIVKAGYENYSMDLMYGTKDETLSEWENDLQKALSFDFPHISAYCLTVENGTEFNRLESLGELNLPSNDKLADFISYTTDFVQDSGYKHYEISNYAKKGFECVHNMLYWRLDGYLGLGAGAHSHYAKTDSNPWGARWSNIRNPAKYMNTVLSSKKPVDFSEIIDKNKFIIDTVVMGMRLDQGIDLLKLKSRSNVIADTDKIEPLINDGLLENLGNFIRITKKGNLVSNEIMIKMVDALS
ncbi:MAG: radical SAM family heme chaperone HemW [Thermodesulfobacteriota bacterium]